MVTRNQIEDDRLKINEKAIASQLAVQQAKVDQMRALADLKQKQVAKLKVRAGVEGQSGRASTETSGSTFFPAQSWPRSCSQTT